MTRTHFATGHTDEAKALVMAYHYSRRWPSVVQVVGSWHEDGGLFGDSGPMVAACVFGVPASRWSEPVMELTRLVREVLAVERRRRKVAGRGQSYGARPDAVTAPSPGVVRGAGGFLPAAGPSPHDAAARVVAELEGRR